MNARLDPPAHLDDERRAIWADTVARLTASGRVFRADPEVLTSYVEAVRSHRQASALLAQTSVLITRGGKVVENPALAVQRKTAEAMARASKTLGLDRAPSAAALGEPLPAGDAAVIHDGRGKRGGPKCGGKLHGRDGTCTLPAGWGTGHPGFGRCRKHLGTTPNVAKAAREEQLAAQAATELARLDVPPVTDPLTELARLAGQAVAWKNRMAAKVNELTELRYEDAKGAEQLRSEIALWERAIDRCVTTLTAMARLGIDERLTGIREATASMLEAALTQALQASGLGLSEMTVARETFRRNIRVVRPEPAEPKAITAPGA